MTTGTQPGLVSGFDALAVPRRSPPDQSPTGGRCRAARLDLTEVPTARARSRGQEIADQGADVLAGRAPHRVATARRAQIRAEANREGATPSATKLARAGGTLLGTTAPPDVLAIRAALVRARVRWPIALRCKRGKREGPLDEWRRATTDRSLGEGSATVTALVLQPWRLLVRCGLAADRSLTQAAPTVRDHVVALLVVWPSRRGVVAVLSSPRSATAWRGAAASPPAATSPAASTSAPTPPAAASLDAHRAWQAAPLQPEPHTITVVKY